MRFVSLRARNFRVRRRRAAARYHRERFVARERELARIAEVVGRPEPGYLLVEAPGGFGKSVLCAQVVDRVLDGRWPGPAPILACFFVRADGARNTTVAFLQAVNGQLLDRLNLAGGTPPELAALQAQLSQLWVIRGGAPRHGRAPAPARGRRPGRDGRGGGEHRPRRCPAAWPITSTCSCPRAGRRTRGGSSCPSTRSAARTCSTPRP
jgi:hypothetical protein